MKTLNNTTMKYNKTLLEQLKRGEATDEMLIMNIMAENPLHDIIGYVIDVLKKEPVTNNPITLAPEDYDRIVSMFRPRGLKIVDGEEQIERRGRKRKILSQPENEQ